MSLVFSRLTRFSLLLIIILPGICFAESAKNLLGENRVVLVSDFDRTLTGRAWNSIWVLKKVPAVNNYFQNSTLTKKGVVTFDELPREVLVTENEYIEHFRNRLAVAERSGQYTIGSRDATLLRKSSFPGRDKPLLFIPGYYTVDADSFRYYRSSPEGNFLLQDNSAAREKETAKISRFGITFSLFQALTSRPEAISNIHIPTARGQSSEEFVDGLFSQWKNEGWIENIYGAEYPTRDGPKLETINIYPLGRGESVAFGDHLTEKKLRLVRDELITHYRLQAMQQKKKFLLILADDNPEIVQEYHRLLLDYSAVSNFRDTLDFMLVHAGSEAELARSPLPDRYTVYESGIARRAPQDYVDTFFPKKPFKNLLQPNQIESAITCQNLFLKGL